MFAASPRRVGARVALSRASRAPRDPPGHLPPPRAPGSTRVIAARRRARVVAPLAAASDERVTVIGEALWDSLPQGLFLGAPANVACHLNELGRAPKVVSRVGDDELEEVLRRSKPRA